MPDAVSPPGYTQLELIGVLVQWASALLLLGLFQQLARLGTQRRLLHSWQVAWLTLLLALTGFLLEPVAGLLGLAVPRGVAWAGGLVYAGCKFGFLALVTMGAVQVAGRQVRLVTERRIALAATAAGPLVVIAWGAGVATQLQVILTPLLFVGAAILVVRSAFGERKAGLNRFAAALALYAALWTVYFAVVFMQPYLGSATELLDRVARSSGYGDAIVASVLGASIVLLLVQDSFLEVALARSQRVRDLAASEARLLSIIEAAEEAIITLDADGRVDLANAAAERLFRLPQRGAVGTPLEVLVSAGDMSLGQVLDDAVTAHAGAPRSGAATMRGTGKRADGSTFPLEFSVGALRAGERQGSVVIVRDLTSRLAVESEREQLERRIAEAEKMTAIGRLVSGVAHELNNPLAVVLGQSEQLLDGARDGEERQALQLIHEQAHRARHIVRDLLASVRQRDEPRESIDLAELTRRMLLAQQARLRNSGVEVMAELETPLPTVLADRVGIEQVVVNLLDNACDAAGRGGTVRVSTSAGATHAEIVVEDSGPGVADHLVTRVFEPFFTTKPVGHGTGLGLPVSLGVVEQHGGTLRLENRPEPGVGARFVLSLPLDAGMHRRDRAPRPVRTALLPAPVRNAAGEASEVLLVDDESAVRATLARVFQRGGWPVREAATAEEALERLLTVSDDDMPALILCDLRMPGMGGREMHGLLRARRPSALERLVFVTGDVVEQETAAFIAGAGCAVVEKPFTVAEIARVVEQILARRS